MKLFEESDRYLYPLTPNSVVVDCGGFEGNFAKIINERYGCRVIVLEPIPEFYHNCCAALEKIPGVSVYNLGLAGTIRHDWMRVKGDSTGLFANSGETVTVELITLKQLMNRMELGVVDLLKLNCEGAEGEILETAIADGTIKRVIHLQVQPHLVMPHAETRWPAIQKTLSETHDMTFCAPWCWEGYTLKT